MSSAPRGRSLWRVLIPALGLLVALLAIANVAVLAKGASVLPGTTKAERTDADYTAVRRAAADGVVAFLAVDYRKMDTLLNDVLDRSTGAFKAQYAGTRSSLEAAAVSAKAVSSGKVIETGVSSMSGNTATVFVAADATVTNNQSSAVKATPACPKAGTLCRYYRLQLSMQKVGGVWKMAKLDFVS